MLKLFAIIAAAWVLVDLIGVILWVAACEVAIWYHRWMRRTHDER